MITRFNYEEYFLLYIDNELSGAEKNAVEEFVRQNPDLQEELSMLEQSVMKAESNIVFGNKNSLLKHPEENTLINLNNYEEYFLLYADNELDAAARKDVEGFIAENPSLQGELSLLLQTKLWPDEAIVFSNKEVLYKNEKERKPIPIAWITSAAAVAVLLITGFLFYNNDSNKNDQHDQKISALSNDYDTDSGKNISATKKEDQSVTSSAQDSLNNAKEIKKQLEEKNDKTEAVAVNKIMQERKSTKNISGKGSKEFALQASNIRSEDLPVDNNKKIKVESRIDEVAYVADTKLNGAPEKIIVKIDKPEETLSTQNENPVTDVASIDANDDDNASTNTSAKKNRLRGIFRRVSRALEKATGSDADDTNKRSVSISSFQIALK